MLCFGTNRRSIQLELKDIRRLRTVRDNSRGTSWRWPSQSKLNKRDGCGKHQGSECAGSDGSSHMGNRGQGVKRRSFKPGCRRTAMAWAEVENTERGGGWPEDRVTFWVGYAYENRDIYPRNCFGYINADLGAIPEERPGSGIGDIPHKGGNWHQDWNNTHRLTAGEGERNVDNILGMITCREQEEEGTCAERWGRGSGEDE